MKPIIYPYSMSSGSAKVLTQALKSLRVYPNRNYRHLNNHLIINWGNSTTPHWGFNSTNLLNFPQSVKLACNKLLTLQRLFECGVSVPEYTIHTEVAQFWIDQGHKVFGRKTLTGHSGQGIIIFDTETITSDKICPLYVKAIKKDKEYRVHVFRGEIIDYQQKKKKQGFVGGIAGIRNHTNGWVYARDGVELPNEVKSQSIKAVAALGLDFGAVDVCTSTEGTVYVFEVNTAPGLQGTTLTKYVKAIKEIL